HAGGDDQAPLDNAGHGPLLSSRCRVPETASPPKVGRPVGRDPPRRESCPWSSNRSHGMDEELRVTYELACDPGQTPEAMARDIALEQTVELPDGCFPPVVGERVVGRVETVAPLAGGGWQARIAYDLGATADDVPQLLNLLFGNISMKRGIRLAALR